MQTPRDLDHSRRRARLRDRVLLTLARRHSASLGELARATRIRPGRIQGILLGDGKEYALDLALVHQGAVAVYEVDGRRLFFVTQLGEEEAERRVR